MQKLCRRAHDCEGCDDGEPWCGRCENYFAECACVGTDQFTDTYGFPSIITAGFPCQDISFNGKGAGIEGERSGLFGEVVRIAGELGPVFLLLENVPALRSRGYDRVAAELEGIGYTPRPFVVGANCVGADHLRKRVWIVAYRAGSGVERVRPAWEQITQPLDRTLLSVRACNGEWKVEPDLRRVVDGVPRWMDRIQCVGNAIVPQIAELFARYFRQTLEQLNAP